MNARVIPGIDQLQELPLAVPPFSYVPQTWGWWALLALLVLATTVWAVRRRRRWQRNRYRREALQRFEQLVQGLPDPQQRLPALRELPTLLKRVALSMADAPPVATLSGSQWQAFLAARAKVALPADFTSRLHTLAYAPATAVLALPEHEISALFTLSRQWIETHHVAA